MTFNSSIINRCLHGIAFFYLWAPTHYLKVLTPFLHSIISSHLPPKCYLFPKLWFIMSPGTKQNIKLTILHNYFLFVMHLCSHSLLHILICYSVCYYFPFFKPNSSPTQVDAPLYHILSWLHNRAHLFHFAPLCVPPNVSTVHWVVINFQAV